MSISVVINTYNAEKHLKEVLESVKDFEEILICDMYSTDSTVEIAKNYNAKIIFHEKINFVEPARNFAVQNAKYEWVLLLDADETISAELKRFVYDFKNNKDGNVCLAIPRMNYFLGKLMRAAYPDYVYRFFKKENMHWPEFIHSIPEIDGGVFKIDRKNRGLAIEHLADDSISEIETKNNIYSTAEIPKRQYQKVSFFKLMSAPFLWFVKFYFVKQGFRDGKEGFIFAILKSQYKFLTLSKLIEHKKSK